MPTTAFSVAITSPALFVRPYVATYNYSKLADAKLAVDSSVGRNKNRLRKRFRRNHPSLRADQLPLGPVAKGGGKRSDRRVGFCVE